VAVWHSWRHSLAHRSLSRKGIAARPPRSGVLAWGIAALATVGGLSLGLRAAQGEVLDVIGVEDGRLTGNADGRQLDTGDLVGSTFLDGLFVYSIVDAVKDPLLPGIWRYRVTWRTPDSREWSAVCRNSRGSTGWAYALPGTDGPRFVCEDTAMAQCLAQASRLSPQAAFDRCISG